MVVAVILLALMCAYLYYMLVNFILKQAKINDVTYDALKQFVKWNEELTDHIDKNEERIGKAEISVANATNKATVNAKKIERMQGYAEH